MEDKLLLTYSLLAHLKENSSDPSNSLVELFVPLIRKAISNYCGDNSQFEIRGKNCSEIYNAFKSYFGLDIPIPILIDVLQKISDEVNDKNNFLVYGDGSYVIKSFIFEEIDADIQSESNDIQILSDDYKIYCDSRRIKFDMSELEKFIRAQQIELFSDKKSDYLDLTYHIPKYVHLKFSDPKIFSIITRIYIGGIIADYFTLKIHSRVSDAELLLDTNYVISLLDLNTEDAYNTCIQLHSLCHNMGFKFSILDSTVTQIQWLLTNRITDFQYKDSLGVVKDNDIYAACIRRDLSKNDLQITRDKIKDTLSRKFHIDIIVNTRISTIIDDAKKSNTYKTLLKVRNNQQSALNDAVAECYVKRKRGDIRSIADFTDVKCWFLHNSPRSYYGENRSESIHKRMSLCADELLTILWLSNPSQTADISLDVIAKGGLSTYVTRYRNAKRPETKVIRDIKLRANKLKELGAIDEKDVYNLTMRMSEGAISGETANEWTNDEDIVFVKNVKNLTLEEESVQKTVAIQATQILNLKKSIDDSNMLAKDMMHKMELKDYERDCNKYIDEQLGEIRHRYPLHTFMYFTFIIFVVSAYVLNNYCDGLPKWISSIIGILLVVLPLLLRFVDHKSLFVEVRYTLSKRYKNKIESEMSKNMKKEYESNNPKPI